MVLNYTDLDVTQVQAFQAPRRPKRAASDAEQFLADALLAAERLQRAGVTINPDTIHTEFPRLPAGKVSALMTTPAWEAGLAERGITDASSPLSPHQLAALTIYMDMSVSRTHAQKLKAARVTNTQWNGWLRQPEFARYLEDISQDALASVMPVARQRIAEGVDRGDKAFIDLALKMTGNDPDQGIDLKLMMGRIFAILDAKISDPEIMADIGRAMQEMMGGVQVAPRPAIQLQPSQPSDYAVPGTTQASGLNEEVVPSPHASSYPTFPLAEE
jgi:hypothetical protein